MFDKKTTASNPVLVTLEPNYGEYSANPADYFMQQDDFIFKDNWLGVKLTTSDGWTKNALIKANPTKADLKNWQTVVKTYLHKKEKESAQKTKAPSENNIKNERKNSAFNTDNK